MGGWVPCHHIHAGSCEQEAIKKFIKVMGMCVKFYAPLHTLPVIIFKRKQLISDPVRMISKTLIGILRSCLFIGVYVASFWYAFCKIAHIRKKTDGFTVILASFICSFSLFFEPGHRRIEIALFLVPRFFEQLWYTLLKRNMVGSVKNIEVFIFAVGLSILMYCFENEPRNIKNSYLSLLNKFFG